MQKKCFIQFRFSLDHGWFESRPVFFTGWTHSDTTTDAEIHSSMANSSDIDARAGITKRNLWVSGRISIVLPAKMGYQQSYHLGCSIVTGIAQNRCFFLGEIPSFERDDDWGYTHDSGNGWLRQKGHLASDTITCWLWVIMLASWLCRYVGKYQGKLWWISYSSIVLNCFGGLYRFKIQLAIDLGGSSCWLWLW